MPPMSEPSASDTRAPDALSAAAVARVPGAWEQAALAAAIVAALFLLQGRLNVNLADEGFLWYGVERTAHGAVPMRDFYAYDPGRYYFAAAFLRIFGPGVVVLRIANAVFQVLGLWCGLRIAARAVRSRLGLALAGVLLALWMYPRHKLYEPSLAMFAAWVGTRLLERPSLRRHAEAGAFVGLAAFFGKNHALYAGCAFAVLLALRWWKALPRGERWRGISRDLGALVGGGVVGALPLLAMLVAVPGFATAYVSVIRGFAAAGRTNLGLPFPWPWRILSSPGPWPEKTLLVTAGIGLVLLPIVYLAPLVRGLRARGVELTAQAAPLAAALVGVAYLHHAFARTDAFHLAQAIHPGLLVLALWVGAASARAMKVAVTVALAAFTFAGALPEMPFVQRWAASAPGDRYVETTVGVDRLSVPARTANLLAGASAAIARTPCGVLAVLPHLPGLYPALGRVSPLWDIYPIWPAAGERDRRMRGELEQGRVDCLLRDAYLSTGEDSFAANYPETEALIRRDYAPVPTPELPQKLRLWHRIASEPGG